MPEPETSPQRRIKATVQYDGTDFLGFQRQAKGRTVQGVLEDALGKLLGHPVTVKGAGRTDSGVHARGQVISFVTENSIPARNIPVALASFLPPDVIISSACDVDEEFDPQKDAVSKTYCYRIWRGEAPDILTARYTYWWPGSLDLGLMEEEAKWLLGRHDFASLRATGSSAVTTAREVMKAQWVRKPEGPRGETWEFWITADGFLYKMVRLIVGTLIDVGRGRLPPGTVKRLLEEPGSGQAGQCAPGRGLCLEKVEYRN
ncbi:MAG: tRNA pseudouridine(38-40) synthase TruA [Bacillota bacterium]|jgi:tRNA pseudouridine38-40 synthase